MAHRILVIEDDPQTSETIRLYLENDGFEVEIAADGQTGLHRALQDSPVLVVLDLMLPRLSGTEVCRAIRKKSNVPIVMLTARTTEDDRIQGLELGADWIANENWRFYAGGNWLDSEIKENSSRPDTVGNQAPYTPDYTVNLSADVNYPISDSLSFIGRVAARWVGKTWFHTVQEGDNATIFMPLFEMGFGAGAGALGLAEYSVSRRDAFSIVDLRLGIAGSNWTLTGIATNLTDEKYLEEVIPAPEFGGSFDHPGSQRRYGVEFSYRY